MSFKQNDLSKKFAEAVSKLVNTGVVKDNITVAESIGLNRSSLSNIMNGRRNVPHDVAEKFQELYKIKILIAPEDEIFSEIESRLIRIEAYLEVFESAIAGLMTKSKNGFMETVSSLRKEVQEASTRRWKELNK